MSTFVKIQCPRLDGATQGLKELASLTSERGALKAAARGLFAWGQNLRTRKIIPRTPKDTGNLRNTITAEVKIDGSRAKLTFYAGGPAAPYAVVVHENLKSSVHWKTPGTGPKYFETPINEEMPNLPDEVQAEVDSATREAMGK